MSTARNVSLGIHWFSFSIKPLSSVSADFWTDCAERIIWEVSDLPEVKSTFGKLRKSKQPLSACSTVYNFSKQSELLAGYSSRSPETGVVIRFPGSALDYLREMEGKEIRELYQALGKLNHRINVAQIDVFVDYLNYDMSLNNLLHDLQEGLVVPCYIVERPNEEPHLRKYPNTKSVKSILRGKNVQTICIGSNKSDSRALIYDKKAEREEHGCGNYLSEEQVIRFEVRFKGAFARKIGQALMQLDSDQSMREYLAAWVLNKYVFIDESDGKKEEINITTHLRKVANNKTIESSNASDSTPKLLNLRYLLQLTDPFLYKLQSLYGMEAIETLFSLIQQSFDRYVPSCGTKTTLKKYKDLFLHRYPDFDSYVSATLFENPETIRSERSEVVSE